MRPERWSQIEGLFLQAIELPPHERERFLGDVCHGDESLRRELNSLLACDIPETPLVNDSFLPPNTVLTDVASPALSDRTSQRIGPYRLLRLLGHGGMGSVHLAVRDDDHYRKQVAIKLLKRGMDTDFMLNRFRQERQILADLEHPFIARLLDGGATDDGLPYFVLEYVDGSPITTYCADHNLDLVERLRLFRLVCEAVQYAHQHLVIHRDLKPGNILITQERIPKLLDFGIAKLMDPERSVETPTLTGVGQRMLTPDYASPEQFLGQTISTASDIYSLGAVLYELLMGQRPHRLEVDSPAAMEKAICEVEPDKPSTAVVRGSQDPPRLRRQRSRELSGDLDNIILTALRKEPQRRYTSVAELSDDLQRHLEGLPVTARDDRFTYRMGKFIRRHKLGAIGALLVVASLGGGIASTVWIYRSHSQTPQESFTVVPLTSYPGYEMQASFSPDGNEVAFAWNGEKQDNSDIYVKVIGPGLPRRLTTDAATDLSPAFSPSGRWIAFLRELPGERATVMLAPALGGAERGISEIELPLRFQHREGLAWTPDERGLVVPDRNSDGHGLFLLSIETGEKRRLTVAPEGFLDHNPAITPDGSTLAYIRANNSDFGDIHIQKLGKGVEPDGVARRLNLDNRSSYSVAWTPDSQELVFASGLTDGKAFGQSDPIARDYAIAPDGRPLIVEPSERRPTVSHLRVITNWHQLLP